MEQNQALSQPLRTLRGISDKRQALFEAMGISCLYDLICHFPRLYENRGNMTTVKDAPPGQKASIILRITGVPHVSASRRNLVRLSFPAADTAGDNVYLVFFNQTYFKDRLKPGTTVRCFGMVSMLGHTKQMLSPKVEFLTSDADISSLPPYVPIYPLGHGITQNMMADAIHNALQILYPPHTPDTLPLFTRERYHLCAEAYAMHQIHRPESADALSRARKRVIFEELTVFALGLALKKAQQEQTKPLPMHAVDLQPFYQQLSFTPTGAQYRAIDAICSNMTSGKSPMNRLLMGDVGSGKTICAAAAIYAAVQNGYQAALMVPTEILARQHDASLRALFLPLGIQTALLIGATKPKEKREIKRALQEGSLPVVIGTHALLEESVSFARLELVITDEQHRFGVLQRAKLRDKRRGVHTLVMSATPIPRTLALMLFGDLEMSVLDELPPARLPVRTAFVDDSYRARMYGFVQKTVQNGEQVYVICPAIDREEETKRVEEMADSYIPDAPNIDTSATNENTLCKCAVEHAEELQKQFPQFRVGCLHGKMKSAEKEAVMQAFSDRKIDILVSTTVIEVGVDVPNATLMIIENAERFGLSQLHQLRGRVGRGKRQSWCILVSNAKTGDSVQRLQIMKQTTSGFEIAKQDLALRGPGDFFSKGGMLDREYRQSGGIRFHLANLCDDMQTVQDAFSAAGEILQNDPLLQSEANQRLKTKMHLQFGDVLTL